jgi:CBS domain-containing protein
MMKEMYMLSRLLRFRLSAERHGGMRLLDLAIDLQRAEHPAVTSLVVQGRDRALKLLPWEAVHRVDDAHRRLVVSDPDKAETVDEQQLARAVLLARDVRDALVLDTENCVAARVNDLWLREDGAQLVLHAADFSPWAVLRWIARGIIAGSTQHELVEWKAIEYLRGDPTTARQERDVHRIDRLRPPEIARMVDALPYLHAAELLALTPEPVAADALEIMTIERQVQVLEELDSEKGARLLGLMAPDKAADLLGWVEPEIAARYLEVVAEGIRNRIVELLRFPPDTAGGIMTNDLVTTSGNLTVAEARVQLRERLREPHYAYYVYVVAADGSGRLMGVVTLRDLLIADDYQSLAEIMLTDPMTIGPLESAKAAARRVADSDLEALPVVGSDGRLLGVVTVDVALVQLAPATWRDQAPRIFS